MLKRAVWFGALAAAAVLGVPAVMSSCQSTCSAAKDCGSDEFCSLAEGTCLSASALGFCKPRPESCTRIEDPVCACDGKTYGNACLAAQAGLSVVSKGECQKSCGGAENIACPEGQYCDLAAGACGTTGASGTCKQAPDSCPDLQGSPVCGCDGKTYDNACLAAAAKTSVLATGACACDATRPCPDGHYCAYASGACLGASPSGTCQPKPTSCPGVTSKVCGCDGKTYDNGCAAGQAGTSIAAMGECPVILGDGGVPDVPLLISEVRTNGPNGDMYGDEFIELYNPNPFPVVVDSTWVVWHQSAQGVCGQMPSIRYIGTGKTMKAYGHMLLAGLMYQQSPPADAIFINTNANVSLADAGSIWLVHAGKKIDAVCYYYDDTTKAGIMSCPMGTPYVCEGTPVSNLPHCGTASASCSVDASFERRPGGTAGNYVDTDDNAADFVTSMPSTPMNLDSDPTPPPDAGTDGGDAGP
jgi:hypothetical protein